jgi:hypothetical protein
MADIPPVVILGAGFGGIGALKKLRDAGVRITLIDKHLYATPDCGHDGPLFRLLSTPERELTVPLVVVA